MPRIIALFIALICSKAFAEGGDLIFVGEAMSASRSEKSCEEYLSKSDNDNYEEICMDRVFDFKYQIKEMIQGNHKGKSIDFTGFYHYWGLPTYTSHKDALVILVNSKYGYMLHSVEWVTKVDGKWFYCSDWPDDSEECKKYESITSLIKTFNKSSKRDAVTGAPS